MWRSSNVRPRASLCCPNAGSWSAPSHGLLAADALPKTGSASTPRRSPSLSSPPSASCSDGSVTHHEVPGQTLSDREKDALLTEQAALIERQAARIAELEGLLCRPRKTSRNSGLPPSCDQKPGRSGSD